eukprot:CAMPEP_0172718000 /NCGR_PEP_ID=MMETSP1074-20121228/73154_1 /TAXON_ID=2916 /ORGANISM="Ceratium fusus, Strain PA161109" /LENGTH=121 /DNA_ID=CAMNT_0013543075 /DNA_START=430 /DNA_END=793 /DNA_ORIENTATION=-
MPPVRQSQALWLVSLQAGPTVVAQRVVDTAAATAAAAFSPAATTTASPVPLSTTVAVPIALATIPPAAATAYRILVLKRRRALVATKPLCQHLPHLLVQQIHHLSQFCCVHGVQKARSLFW